MTQFRMPLNAKAVLREAARERKMTMTDVMLDLIFSLPATQKGNPQI